MPKGPRGEKRPADVVANAVHVMRVLTGQVDETPAQESISAKSGRLGGLKGGKARAALMTDKERTESASKAAKARWSKKR